VNRTRLTSVAVIVVLGAGTGAIPVVQAQQRSEARSHERSLDRAALAAVKVIQASTLDRLDDDFSSPLVSLTVRNAGPAAVTITGARLDRAGVHDSPIMKAVPPGTTAELNLSIEDACPAVLPPQPSKVVLTVLTSRHQKKTVPVDVVGTHFAKNYDGAVKEHCGRVPLAKALHFYTQQTAVSGTTITGSGTFFSSAGYPVTVTALSAGPGVAVVLDHPLPLRFAPDASIDTTLRVTITSCSALLNRARAEVSGGKALVIGALRATVTGNGGTTTYTSEATTLADDLLTVFKKQCAGGVA
jgi:hypothetical protein